MFKRRDYKKAALRQLKGRWTGPVLIALVLFVLFIAFGAGDFFHSDSLPVLKLGFTQTGIIEILVAGVILLAYFHVMIKLYNTELTGEKIKFEDLIEGFNGFVHGMLGGLWMGLWVALWTCLFIIPGFVKAVAYSQMFFVMAENPGVGPVKAMKISIELTKGHKADLFVMGLSFLGWEFLGLLTCGIGSLWVKTYENLAFVNAYFALKEEAFKSGRLTPADFESN